jgi:hypothetical protein
MTFAVFGVYAVILEETMHIRIPRLGRREKEEYFRWLQQMQAEGIDVEVPELRLQQPGPLDILIAGGPATGIFDLPGGGAAFVIWVRLVAGRPVTVLDCAMTTAWDDQIVLQGFFDERTPLWRLGHVAFPRSQVLNMRIMDSLHLGYHKMVEGVILFTGLKPMPESFHHGMIAPFTLVLVDQNENEVRVQAELFVDRTWQHERKVVHPKSSLRDPVEIPETSEPGFRPNLNVGPVRDTAAEMLKNRAVRKEAEAESEPLAALRKAFSQLRQR